MQQCSRDYPVACSMTGCWACIERSCHWLLLVAVPLFIIYFVSCSCLRNTFSSVHSPNAAQLLSNRTILLKEQVQETALPQQTAPHPPALFGGVGPRMEDWVEYLRGMAEDLDKDPSAGDAKTLGLEEQLFLQVIPE